MRVRFWGTRGSAPVAMSSAEVQRKLVTALVAGAGRGLDTAGKARAFLEQELDFSISHTFGGNSSCVQLETGDDDYVVCDVGSGARVFGNSVLATRGPAGHRFHVFMSHLHWDHIMGFPFFMPAYLPGNHVRIYGCHDTLEEAFRRQNAAPSFPVDFSRMAARIEFVRLEPERDYEIAGLRVRAKRQHHGGDSYGYRLERRDSDAPVRLECEVAPGRVALLYEDTGPPHDPFASVATRMRRRALRTARWAGSACCLSPRWRTRWRTAVPTTATASRSSSPPRPEPVRGPGRGRCLRGCHETSPIGFLARPCAHSRAVKAWAPWTEGLCQDGGGVGVRWFAAVRPGSA